MNITQEILNEGLAMALEFGENLNKPVAPRLKVKYPEIDDEKLNGCENLFKTIKAQAFKMINDHYFDLPDQEKYKALQTKFCKWFLKKYEWLNEDNLQHLFSQNVYLASK